MYVNQSCYGLFVDINDNLYCSIGAFHQVVMQSLNNNPNTLKGVAGTGCPGIASNMLYSPRGIFVDIDLSLYVADASNNRIQLFLAGQLDAITVAGNGVSGSITLNYPTGIMLDNDGNLFISEESNSRITASGPNGFRCLVGCTGLSGSASNQLHNPYGLTFDSYGNIFVTDASNNRTQRFLLATNSCGKYL
jgi:DNA-binding beta-propeller fold protein YncE